MSGSRLEFPTSLLTAETQSWCGRPHLGVCAREERSAPEKKILEQNEFSKEHHPPHPSVVRATENRANCKNESSSPLIN